MNISESDIRSAINRTIAEKKEFRPERTRAAVLIPVISTNDSLSLLLTQRTDLVEHHKNQVSFPGGAVDAGDSSIIDAALRETEEELGIPPDTIEVIGTIHEVTTPSQFHITPVVGILKHLPPLTLNTTEVKNAFIVPLSFFTKNTNERIEYREFEGATREVYFFEYGDKIIWGVTAYMIKLFLQCIQESKQADS